MLRSLLALAYGCLLLTPAAGQTAVPNDDIARRLPLTLNKPALSRTDGCTVQRKCVDERLTGKCIEYHNDQWFAFTPPANDRYYVNIGGQQCREVRGVQLVVAQGTPCEPATYRILNCTSLSNQDDVFVELPGLRAGQEYLLNVDGYLHDYCRFSIEVSTKPQGTPLEPHGTGIISDVAGRTVVLGWGLPDTLEADYFEVWRHDVQQFRSKRVRRVPTSRDTHGRWEREYEIIDTLPKTVAAKRFEYRIVAHRAGQPTLISKQVLPWLPSRSDDAQQVVDIDLQHTPNPARTHLALALADFPAGRTLDVLVLNGRSGQELRHWQLVRAKDCTEQSRLALEEFHQQGIRKILVRIQQLDGDGRMTLNSLYWL